MTTDIVQQAHALGGVISSYHLGLLGKSKDDIRKAVAQGQLTRVRSGAFVLTEVLHAAAPSDAYRLRVAAIVTARNAPLANKSGSTAARLSAASSAPNFRPECTRLRARASHHAGLALHGLPLYDCDLSRVDLAAAVVHASRSKNVHTHPVQPGDQLMKIGPVHASSLATCVVLTAATSGATAGVVALDDALQRGLLTKDEVLARAATVNLRYGRARVAQTVELADGTSESPGESRTRMLLQALGFSVETQVEVRGRDGFRARVDFLIGKVVVEFDGAVKYAAAGGRGELVREKWREDALRSLGYEVVRLTWADLDDPSRVMRLMLSAQARLATRRCEAAAHC